MSEVFRSCLEDCVSCRRIEEDLGESQRILKDQVFWCSLDNSLQQVDYFFQSVDL